MKAVRLLHIFCLWPFAKSLTAYTGRLSAEINALGLPQLYLFPCPSQDSLLYIIQTRIGLQETRIWMGFQSEKHHETEMDRVLYMYDQN